MMLSRVETQWIKSANIYSINYTLNSVSKRIFFFTPMEIVCKMQFISMQIIWTVHMISVSWFFFVLYLLKFQIVKSLHFFFQSHTAHTKSNWVFASFFPWTFNHKRWHVQNKIRNNWHLIKTLSIQEMMMMREKYVEWNYFMFDPKHEKGKIENYFQPMRNKTKTTQRKQKKNAMHPMTISENEDMHVATVMIFIIIIIITKAIIISSVKRLNGG